MKHREKVLLKRQASKQKCIEKKKRRLAQSGQSLTVDANATLQRFRSSRSPAKVQQDKLKDASRKQLDRQDKTKGINAKDVDRTRNSRRHTRQMQASKRLSFECTELPDNPSFDGFDRDPDVAALLLHCNSGHAKFESAQTLLQMISSGERERDPNKWGRVLQKLLLEIEAEIVTPQEKQVLSADYLQNHGKAVLWRTPSTPEADHLCCGMCGIKTVDGRHNRKCGWVQLQDLPKEVRVSGERLKEWNRCKAEDNIMLPVDEDG